MASLLQKPVCEALNDLLYGKDHIRVLEAGCGSASQIGFTPRIHAVGIDIDPQRIAEANANARRAGVEKLVRFQENDLFQADIKEATVVTLFLLSSVNLKLKPKLLADLKPGTRIVSNTFDMGDWKPDKEAIVPDTEADAYLSHRLYLWTVPVPEKTK